MASIEQSTGPATGPLVARWQQCATECRIGRVDRALSTGWGLAIAPKSSHGPAMIDVRAMSRAIALVMVTMLVAASTVIPSLAFAHSYSAHLAQYGGYDARVSTVRGFARLYVNPDAPMLPVVLSLPSDVDMAAVLPSPCLMDKTVLPSVAAAAIPAGQGFGYVMCEPVPSGLDQPALRGPPRGMA